MSKVLKAKTVEAYLREFGPQLAGRIMKDSSPLFEPGVEQWDERMRLLLRKPFQAQGDTIMGIVRCLEKERSVFVVGEMGVGKTLIGASAPFLASRKPCRTLVMCPGHLVGKWIREVRETVPDARCSTIRSFKDLVPLRARLGEPPLVPEYHVISRDRAKLGCFWRPVFLKLHGFLCCPQCFSHLHDRDDVPVREEWFGRKRSCPECGSPLWQADGSRCRRYAPSEYIKRHLKGHWDFFICDECHEEKGGNTAQGNALGMIASSCSKTIAMTGTLSSGYADDLFYLIYRLSPRVMRDEGLNWSNTQEWLSRYGVLERVTRHPADSVDNYCSRGKRSYKSVRRRPGVSPAVFARHLMHQSVYLHLDDIAADLPPFNEQVIQPELGVLGEAYAELEADLAAALKQELAMGNKRLLGTYLNALLAYPDRPFGWGELLKPGTRHVVASPREIRSKDALPKEEELLALVGQELRKRRKVYVFCTYTGTRDVSARLRDVLVKAGFKADILRSQVKPEAREDWIRAKVRSGVEVIVSNMKLVQTGLDLIDFPTLVFYQTGFSVFSLRQASRRSWRIGQKEPVSVYYLAYRGTLQEKAMVLMGQKLQASLALEGKFSDQGLLSLTQGEDMATALAKALVEKTEMQSVENVWGGMRADPAVIAQPATAGRAPLPGQSRTSALLTDLFGLDAVAEPVEPKTVPLNKEDPSLQALLTA